MSRDVPGGEVTSLGYCIDELTSYYGCAVLHLIWDVHRRTRARTLLCASVELLPKEIPAPLECGERYHQLSRDHYLYTADRVASCAQAIQWLDLARSGSAARLTQAGALPEDLNSAPRFEPVLLDEEPVAPLLLHTRRIIPFSARWHAGTRSRHLIARSFRIEHLWSSNELERALEWLNGNIGFDFSEAEEFWGSVHILAPNPIFRSLRGRLDRSATPAELIIAVEHRAGQERVSLRFELESIGPLGTVFTIRAQLNGAIHRIPLPAEPEQMYERVFDQNGCLLYELGPFVFLGGVQTTINLSSKTRLVSARLADGTPDTFSVPIRGELTQVSTSRAARSGRDAVIRLAAAAGVRSQRERGRAGQRWFRDQLAEGIAELRKLVGNATEMVWIADPYFSGDDVRRLLLAVQDSRVPLRILVSARHLRSKYGTLEHGDILRQRLLEAQEATETNPIAVRVMEGKDPPLHDRLLLIDEDLWTLGSSLNAFGRRGTMLLKVPDPEPVLSDLERLWDAATELDRWLTARRARREPNGDSSGGRK